MHRGDPNEIAVEERGREGEGEEEGVVGGRDPEAREGEDGLGDDEVEDPHPMEDTEEDLVVQKSVENLMDWTHLNLTLCSY